MGTTYIIGAFEFLGFHFCEKILDEGKEVVGICFVSNNDTYLIEEKRLHIGRNANFSECDLLKLDLENIDSSKNVWIVDFYDFFVRDREEQVFKNESLNHVFEQLDKHKNKIVLLLPISLFSQSIFQEEKEQLQNWLGTFEIPVQEIYLPTIYGPWQPKEFLFHQALSDEGKQWNYTIREWTGDAIYVEDMVTEILRIIEEGNDKYLLISKEKEQWKQVAAQLKLGHQPVDEQNINFDGMKKFVEPSISIEQGLEKQKRMMESLRFEE
ncbi:hypothetical protein [Robertmurraya kyonggiensis]|uniref:Uncharacterized protein n=1 Tax=Robertmurraya kyonggiensis TaxID=1037680 RepID=A0A4V5P1I4_9BACI|nr:hypothetical protein [Robertmurraya kyonggiensis]TKC18270.1 hypothetical protein FA727_01565 [Robertmurraya kyonggiensis]